jgi:hypothetical protein
MKVVGRARNSHENRAIARSVRDSFGAGVR